MKMQGERHIAAPPDAVWRALNEPKILERSIPGCESVERTGDTTFDAVATVKIGPVSARFRGKVELSDLDPPRGYRIQGEGQGGAAGFARGGAVVGLEPEGSGTLLRYTVDATVGGKLAQLGARLVDAAARKMADEFFTRFDAAVAGPPAAAVPAAPPPPAAGGMVAVFGVVLLLLAFALLFSIVLRL
jgi:hypothetical protein